MQDRPINDDRHAAAAATRRLEVIAPGGPVYGGSEPMLGAIYAYWHAKAAGHPMPARRDLDVVEMPRAALPYLMLIDVIDGGAARRYRYRLVGTEMVNVIGYDVTGRYLDEIIPDRRRHEVFGWLDRVVDERVPLALEMPLGWENRDFRHARRVALPLSSDGRNVDMLLCGFALS